MDIVTHAGIGLIAASPFLANQPELAVGFIAGSVLPDLDALWRLLNKRAFLEAHQTWSHALPVQAAFSVVAGSFAALFGGDGLGLGVGLVTGLIGHSLLDWTNTFGVALFKPFAGRRFCLEWVFFIDAMVLAATAIALAWVIPRWIRGGDVPVPCAVVYLGFVTAYILSKGVLRCRAGRYCPWAKSLVPSALVPWRFFGTEGQKGGITLFRVNALTGRRARVADVPVLDESFVGVLEGLAEFQLMREVSPEYHVVSATAEGEGTHLLCRDMRLRNFGTRFGDLEVWLDANRQVIRTRFHV